MSEFLNISEVAEILKVSDRTVRNLIKDGALTGYAFGRVYRIKKEDLESYIQGAEVKKGE